jgi:hypothetical protein
MGSKDVITSVKVSKESSPLMSSEEDDNNPYGKE